MTPLSAKTVKSSHLPPWFRKSPQQTRRRCVSMMLSESLFPAAMNRVRCGATSKDGARRSLRATTVLNQHQVLAVDQTAAANSTSRLWCERPLEVTPEEAEILLKVQGGVLDPARVNAIPSMRATPATRPPRSKSAPPKAIPRAPLLAQEPRSRSSAHRRSLCEAGHD